MTAFFRIRPIRPIALLASLWLMFAASGLSHAQSSVSSRGGDHIVAVVNQELVTAGEVERRVEQLRIQAARSVQSTPSEETLRKEALETLIDERVVVTHSRDAGWRVDEADIDRAVQSVALQNQLTLPQLEERLRGDGIDMSRFRIQLRDQIMIERTREREVAARIVISEEDIDAELAERRAAAQGDADINIAQILIAVPEGADEATLAARRARADAALARVRAGEPFEAVAREISDDANRERGGEIGVRPASRMPDLFISATRALAAGEVISAPVRSGAGFHILKLLMRSSADAPVVTETRARHILLRVSEQAPAQTAARRLAQIRQQITNGERKFEEVAREVSEDGTAPEGGDLGWFRPGVMVPEFEQPMNALPVGALSEPVLSRFGVHLIQVMDRRAVTVEAKDLRQQVRNELRERKFQTAFDDWLRELRARAYVELREPVDR